MQIIRNELLESVIVNESLKIGINSAVSLYNSDFGEYINQHPDILLLAQRMSKIEISLNHKLDPSNLCKLAIEHFQISIDYGSNKCGK